jgi:lipopolysaccharide export system protein LptA
MRMRDANRYARWAAIFASLLAAIVLIIYVRRSYQAHAVQKEAPPPVPAAVERSSLGFTLSNTTGTGKLWSLRASSATAYKQSDRVFLSDVWITIYGKKGDRNDNIHTQSCDFFSTSGKVVCSGEVKMDLESAEEVGRVAATPKGIPPRIVHITTRGVTFNKISGETVTDEPVEFQFPGGEGHAVGANYDSGDGVLILRRDIHLNLTPPIPKGTVAKAPPSPVELDGASLEFKRSTQVMLLHGPVIARQSARPATVGGAPSQNPNEERELRASLLTVNLDKQFHASRIVATGDANNRPEMRATGAKGNGAMSAEQFIADLAPAGWVEHFAALGNVLSDYRSATDASHITASRMDAQMVPKINQPKTVTATGAVHANSTRGSSTRSIETAALSLDFIPGPPARAGGKPRYQLSHARSLAPATVTMSDLIAGQPATQQLPLTQQRVTHVSGQQVEAEFGDHNRMKRMQAHGGTQMDRDLPNRPRQTSTSQDLAAEFDPQGQWTSFEQSGNVHIHQADRTGQASRAHIDRATDFVTLFGPAEASDATSHTSADTITINQRTDEIHAEGNVRSSFTGKPADSRGSTSASANGNPGSMGPILNLGSGPANIISDHLVGNSVTGHALYTGHARMWQGDSIMEAEEIELNRATSQLDARGHVQAVFESVPNNPAKGLRGGPLARPVSSTPSAAKEAKPELWHIRTSKLTYLDAESRAHLDDGFTAESQDGSIAGQSCDIFFIPPAQRTPGSSGRIDHAIALGHVVIRQDTRHGQSERADYTAAEGKFVLSGGKPTFFDGDGNSIQGHKLTFFQADDTIVVESEEGVRTLTRHRVQK